MIQSHRLAGKGYPKGSRPRKAACSTEEQSKVEVAEGLAVGLVDDEARLKLFSSVQGGGKRRLIT
jgi:hypothetical protein